MKAKIFLLFLASLCVFSTAQSPAGLYVLTRNDLLQSIGYWFSLKIADTANTMTSIPPYSGSTSEASYTISNFGFDINLSEFSYTETSFDGFTFNWAEFSFIFQCNYHICANSFPNPCEDGIITISTVPNNGVKMSIGLAVDLATPTVTVTATSAQLIYGPNDIEVDVFCTNTICLIPTSDIANAIASNFAPAFQNGIISAVNQAAAQYITQSLLYPLTTEDLQLDLRGDFFSAQSSVVVYSSGVFRSLSNPNLTPPISPGPAPPMTAFSNPTQNLILYITPSFFETLIWSLGVNGEFNKTITQAEVPPMSPVKLETNNLFFTESVPGLRAYPNMNITINTLLANITQVLISATDVRLEVSLEAEFSLINQTFALPSAFGIKIGLGSSITLSLTQQGSNLVLTSSLSNWEITVVTAFSKVGIVEDVAFQGLILLGVTEFFPKLPAFNIPLPSDPQFSVSNPVLALNPGYVTLSVTMDWTQNNPTVTCPGNNVVCAEDNTCCQWSGSWGCCTIPNALCCGDDCCPGDWACCEDECCPGDCCPSGICCPDGGACCDDGECCLGGECCDGGGCCIGGTCCDDGECCLGTCDPNTGMCDGAIMEKTFSNSTVIYSLSHY